MKYDDGLYLPMRHQPLPDAVSGATPKGCLDVRITTDSLPQRFAVMVEINHSTDFNECYPRTAKENTLGYSGGEEGCGQPALVYRADIDMTSGKTEFKARLVGTAVLTELRGRYTKICRGLLRQLTS